MVTFRVNTWKSCPYEKFIEELKVQGYEVTKIFEKDYSFPNGVSYTEMYFETNAPLDVIYGLLGKLNIVKYDHVLDKHYNCIIIL